MIYKIKASNMFLQYGTRRINVNAIKEYKPVDSPDYRIEITYSDGKKETLFFFNNKKGRDYLVQRLDDLIIIEDE